MAEVLRTGVHHGPFYRVNLRPATSAELMAATETIGAALYAEGYYGMVGVDAMLGPDGTLYPCLEINARFNMSTYQSRICERFIPPGAHAVAATIGLRPARAHSFDEVSAALGDLLFDGSRRPGVLVNNFATLNAAAGGGGFHGRLDLCCVADSGEAALAVREAAEGRLQRLGGSAPRRST